MEMASVDVSSPLNGLGGLDASLDIDAEESSPTRDSGRGPPSEASSQEWDNVTDPGARTPAS